MKGLLIKDIKLMNAQRTFFIVIIAMSICMAYFMGDISFLVGFLSIVIPMFVLSSISYDEFDNGNAFLFTLPISRKEYVIEKYFFGVLLGFVSLILAVVLSLGIEFVQGTGDFMGVLVSAPFVFSVMLVFLSILIPLHIKFGGEKSRFAIIAVVGILLAIGYAIEKILSSLGVDVEKILTDLVTLHTGILVAGTLVFVLIFGLLSIKISISILEKKEF